MSQQRTLEQRRAKAAWEAIEAVKKENVPQGKYRSLVRNAPADIQINGLGQSLAFWRANKDKREQAVLYSHVSRWVMGQLGESPNADLMKWITVEASSDRYRQATAEAMAFLQWLKRFAEAELEGE